MCKNEHANVSSFRVVDQKKYIQGVQIFSRQTQRVVRGHQANKNCNGTWGRKPLI